MTTESILKLATLAGEIMLANGAETYRVEDTMERIMKTYNCDLTEAFVIPTGIMASAESLSSPNEGIVTIVKRIKYRDTNLEKVTLVNQFSRDIMINKIPQNEATQLLNEIKNKPPYNKNIKTLFAGVSCLGFCYIYGGTFLDSFAAFIVGTITYILSNLIYKKIPSSVIKNLFSGMLIGILSMFLFSFAFGNNFDKIIIGSILPYVPGLVLTNAARDIIEGDFLSGVARISDAIIVSVSLAIGVGFILIFWLPIFKV